jgi:hypothetical protein
MRYIQCWQIFEDETLDMLARYGGMHFFDFFRSSTEEVFAKDASSLLEGL